MSQRQITCAAVAAIALAVAATTAPAADIFWQGGNGALNDPNYFKPSTGETNLTPPATTDFEDVGASGVVTLSDPLALTLARLRIGHNFTDGGTQGPAGPATFNVTGGSLVLAGTTVDTTKSNDTQGTNGGLIIGYNESGAVNISGGSVTVGRYVVVGLDNTNDSISNAAGATATLNISGTGTLAITHASNLASTVYVGDGVPGSLTISDSGSLVATSAKVDLQVGTVSSGAFTQTGGNTSMSSSITVGGGTVAGALMAVSGGTVTGSAVNVGTDTSTGAALTLSNNASLTSTGGFTVGAASGASATNAAVTFSGNSSVTVGGAMTVGNGASTGSSLTISDNANVKIGNNGLNNLFVGRGTTDNTTFTMTGGTLSITKFFLMGTGNASGGVTSHPTNIVGNHSGGAITTGDNFVIADANGQSTYNLSGTGSISSGGRIIVGRQSTVGVMNQTGGSASATFGVRIGDSQPAAGTSPDPALNATGTYNISGGTLNASIPDPTTADALAIAPAGNGTLHVIGGGATVNVTGNMSVYANTSGTNVGTLAYTLEAGESLTEINVTGTATFNVGSVLSLDLGGTTPGQTSYDLLTAADVIDNGLTPALPAGWNYRIVTGGNGEVLQAFAAVTRLAGDVNGDGFVNSGDINAFIFALSHDAAGFASQYPTGVYGNADVNGTGHAGDTFVNAADINPFIQILSGAGEPGITAALAAVPEPTSLGLFSAGAVGLLARRRRHG